MSGNKCPIVAIYNVTSKGLETRLKEKLKDFGLVFYEDDHGVMYQKRTHVYVTFHPTEESTYFANLCKMPPERRRRWIHFKKEEHINANAIWNCFLCASIGFPEEMSPGGGSVPEHLRIRTDLVPLDPHYFDEAPLVSVFTTTYRSKEKILRVVGSLLRQTYINWELVILDDSNDDGVTFGGTLNNLPKDPRIRRYFPGEASGYIGEVKKLACGLCKGKILFEIDHDDALEPNCLQQIVSAFLANPDAGFVYGDGAEIYEKSLKSHEYCEGYGLGYGTYYNQFSAVIQRWAKVARSIDLNASTLVDIVGVPNHPRVWRADFYHAIGGHNPDLSVADDYELLARTFLRTKMVRVPTLMYLQYRNESGNFTFIRNDLIRRLQARISWHYRSVMEKKLQAMSLPIQRNEKQEKIWTLPDNSPHWKHANRTIRSDGITKIVLIRKGKVVDLVPKKLGEKDYVVVVAYGNHDINQEMEAWPITPENAIKIRWWGLKTETREDALQYAKMMMETADYELIE